MSSSVRIGISIFLRIRVTCFFVERAVEKTSKITGVPDGQRIRRTAASALILKVVLPSIDCIISPGRSPDS
jgi:hypothetical protein